MLSGVKGFLLAGLLIGTLAACAPDPALIEAGIAKPPEPQMMTEAYAASMDAGIPIPAIPLDQVPTQFQRQTVYFPSEEAPGTIIINPAQRVLHLITGKNQAVRYGIAVGKAGFEWSGVATITDRKTWPTWTPPKEMIERKPELAKWEDGQPGGPTNPLGARALYLTSNGVDYGYRIHGTPEWQSIGSNASSGCIRMINQDVIDLYSRVPNGSKVVVLDADGSIPTTLKLPPPAPKPVKKVAAVVTPTPAPVVLPPLPTLPPLPITGTPTPVTPTPVPVTPAPATLAPVVLPPLPALPAIKT